MKIFCTRLAGFKYNPWEGGFVAAARRALGAAGGPYRPAEDPEEADMIIVFESNRDKTACDIRRYERDAWVRRYPERLFTINYEPRPAGFLPGLYTGLCHGRMDTRRHRGWAYMFPPLPKIMRTPESPVRPSLLFGFRGARSHPVRDRLLATDFRSRHAFAVAHVDRWFDHTDEEHEIYAAEILASHFTLCPRGLSPSSHRCYEVMALGRCPVIISDDWIAPRGVDWTACSVRVAEADIARLPEILEARLPEAEEMGAAARREWERWFAPETRFQRAVDELVDLRDSRPAGHDERAARAGWRSREFAEANGWLWRQRLRRGLRESVDRLLGRRGRIR